MPEAARAHRPDLERIVARVHVAAARLKQRSRFLCRQSDRLRGRSNDLLTVAMLQRRLCRAMPDARRAHLTLLP